jgi:hypothetical protein
MVDFEAELGKAVKYFWQVRGKQKRLQGGKSGKKDAGERGSVTGGKHADGFIRLIATIVKGAALPNVEIAPTFGCSRRSLAVEVNTKRWPFELLP